MTPLKTWQHVLMIVSACVGLLRFSSKFHRCRIGSCVYQNITHTFGGHHVLLRGVSLSFTQLGCEDVGNIPSGVCDGEFRGKSKLDRTCVTVCVCVGR